MSLNDSGRRTLEIPMPFRVLKILTLNVLVDLKIRSWFLVLKMRSFFLVLKMKKMVPGIKDEIIVPGI